MKSIFSSIAFQDDLGNALTKGSIILTLPPGVYLIASGGGQVFGSSAILNLDGTGKLASTTIWASDELSPQVAYNVTLCAQANGFQPVANATWFIGGTSPIDLSLMTPSVTGPSYSGAVVLNPTAQQTINGQTLNMEGAPLTFSATGSTIPTAGFSRTANGTIAVGNGSAGDTSGAFRAASFTGVAGTPLAMLSGGTGTSLITNWGRSTTEAEIAIPAANGFVFNNADLAGGDFAIRVDSSARKIYLGTGVTAAPVAVTNTGLNLYTASGTLPVAIQNDGGGAVQIGTPSTNSSLTIGANPFGAFSINPGTALVSNPTAGQARRGMTYAADPAGDVTFWYNTSQTGAGYFFKDGANGNTMVVPTGAGTLVARATTDQLSNKTLTGANSGNAVTLLNSQDTLAAVTGNGADQTLYTYTIPANTIQAGKSIRVTVTILNNNAVAPSYKLKLGATTLFSFSGTSVSGDFLRAVFEISNNAGVQNAQVACGLAINGPTYTLNNSATSAENTANALALVLTANEANPNTVGPKKWLVELIQ